MDDWLKLALLGSAAATGGAALGGAGLLGGASMGGTGLAAGAAPGLASMGGGTGLLAGAAAPGLAAPAGALTGTPATGGLLSQAMPYVQGAGNVLGAASAAKNLAAEPSIQAPSAGLGGGQPIQLAANGLTANQRRLRGLLG